MTFLNATLNNLEETIFYHQQQIEKTQSQLDQVKLSQAYGEEAVSSVEEAIENINPEHLELLKEHLLSLFETQPIVPQERINSNDIKPSKEVKPPAKEQEDTQKTRTKLLGIPDFTPTKYEDLAPNISYSSDGRAYVGFNNKDEAEEFRDAISEPSLLDDAVIMNGFKFEVKFHCSREYIEGLAQSVNSMSDDLIENFEEISPRVIYNHNDKTVYLGMTAKSRCDYYGQYLTGQLTVGEKYTYSNKPSFINAEQYKYELRITKINLEDAIHLASFDLQRDPEHSDNAKLLTDWRANRVRQHPPAYTPLPKAIALEEVKLGDIVTTDATKVKGKQYKVLGKTELEGVPHVEAICIFNREMPALVNNCSWFKEIYPVEAKDVRIAPQFKEDKPKQEEVLTEDV